MALLKRQVRLLEHVAETRQRWSNVAAASDRAEAGLLLKILSARVTRVPSTAASGLTVDHTIKCSLLR
jgi:hypothetical protein